MVEYIPREAAVTVCDEQYKECLRKSDFCGDTVAWNICADIKAIPAADVAPVVHGRWKNDCDGCWLCTACGEVWQTLDGQHPKEHDMKFCPCCGAKMDGGADNG